MHLCNIKSSVHMSFSRFRQHLVIYLINETAMFRDVETERSMLHGLSQTLVKSERKKEKNGILK